MELAIQKIAVICFVLVGLSHIMQPKAWARFFAQLCAKGEPGAFVNGFMCLAFGALIVGFHNVWHGIPMILTLMG